LPQLTASFRQIPPFCAVDFTTRPHQISIQLPNRGFQLSSSEFLAN
jgi:hypothetical protein